MGVFIGKTAPAPVKCNYSPSTSMDGVSRRFYVISPNEND